MKKVIFTIILFLSCLITLAGCNNKEQYNESNYEITTIENVSIDIYDISLTGAMLIIKDMNKEPYVYGEWYVLQKEENGKWYNLETIIDDYGFNEMGYLVDENNEVKFIINWEWLYGKLPQGCYRILKEVDHRYIAVDFCIATTS